MQKGWLDDSSSGVRGCWHRSPDLSLEDVVLRQDMLEIVVASFKDVLEKFRGALVVIVFISWERF